MLVTLSLILTAVATVTGLISFFIFDVPSRIKEIRYAVYLTPKTIFINQSNWATKKSLQIVNNNAYPIYAVQLKISETKIGSNIDGFQIKPQPHLINTNFSSTTDMNGIVVSGNSKTDNKKWKRALIYKIDPHSQIDVELTIPASTRSERFNLKITHFQKESINILEQKNTTLFPFEVKD